MQQLPFDVTSVCTSTVLAFGIWKLWVKLEALIAQMMTLWEKQIIATEKMSEALRELRTKIDSQRLPNDLT